MHIRPTLFLLAAPLLAQTAAGPAPKHVHTPAKTVAAKARASYDRKFAKQTVPLLQEVLRFPTVAGNDQARKDQQAWLRKVGTALGLTVRDAGLVTEIELPGPAGAPVLGLVVHGDVQPVEVKAWSRPPFDGSVSEIGVVWQGAKGNGEGPLQPEIVYGRGAADDKGPLVQALLAMKALKETHAPLTHTLRLLVGSDEESANLDMAEYLKGHTAPAFSLVLDSAFPVVVGEKGWNALWVDANTAPAEFPAGPRAVRIGAGLAASIVPDSAEVVLAPDAAGSSPLPAFGPLMEKLQAQPLPLGTRLELRSDANSLHILVHGKSAHAGVNLEGGRNALVALAQLTAGHLPKGGANELLAFALLAGRDIYGDGLGLTETHPVYGRMAVNVATIKPNLDKAGQPDGTSRLTINIRRTPVLTGAALKAHLEKRVAEFNARTGAHLVPGGFYGDDPLSFDPDSKLVKRLLAAYARGTGHAEPPAISGGGTYAKRLPNAIAFGMWFPGKPYPGHDVDEQIPVADLHRGVHVLLEALGDLACGAPLAEPFKP